MADMSYEKENPGAQEASGVQSTQEHQKKKLNKNNSAVFASSRQDFATKHYALEYARLGFEVFPSPPSTKQSYKSKEHSGSKWGKTSDSEQIKKDWLKWPNANVGIATGSGSGFFVIDLDAEPGGLENWDKLVGD